MNDVLERYPPSSWRPAKRPDGKIEINVSVYHPETGRRPLCSLTLMDYIATWNEGRLAFQWDGKPKPDSLPTPEEIQAYVDEGIVPQVEEVDVEEECEDVVETSGADAGPEIEEVEAVPADEAPRVAATRRADPNYRHYEQKFAVVEGIVHELRIEASDLRFERTGKRFPPEEMSVRRCDIVARAAEELRMSPHSVLSFFQYVPKQTLKQWLYGKTGKKRTRSEIKFEILLEVREKMRKAELPAPNKAELARAAAEPLDMQFKGAYTYICMRLTPADVTALELSPSALTRKEKKAILLREHALLKANKSVVRIFDLARAAAPYLDVSAHNVRWQVRTFFTESEKKQMGFLESTSDSFKGLDIEVIRAGIMAAFPILKLKQRPPTLKNVSWILRILPRALESFLEQHQDIAALIEEDDSS